MPQRVCRLCLSTERLVNVFDSLLNFQQQIRTCVLLCTGVDIRESDRVSKLVCSNCCTIVIKLFKFRKNAIANDKALKEYEKQPYIAPVSNKEDIAKFHKSILQTISNAEENEFAALLGAISIAFPTKCNPEEGTVATRKNIETKDISSTEQRMPIDLDKVESRTQCQKGLDTSDNHTSKTKNIETPLTDSHLLENTSNPDRSCDSKSRSEFRKKYLISKKVRKRIVTDSDSPEVIPTKRKRIFFKESGSPTEIDLQESSSSDDQTRRSIFTSSVELTSVEKCTIADIVKDARTGGSIMENVRRESVISNNSEISTANSPNTVKQIACKFCNNTYLGNPQLRLHVRMKHENCIVCNTNHRAQTITFMTLRKPCSKYIQNNQPILRLIRIDEISSVTEKYKDAFDYNEAAIQEVYDEEEEEEEDMEVIDEYQSEFTSESIDEIEKQQISKIFQNHIKDQIKSVKSKFNQTDGLETEILSATENKIVLPYLYIDLSTYNTIPVKMTVKQKWSAQISYESSPKPTIFNDSWNPSVAIDLTKPLHTLKNVTPKRQILPKFVVISNISNTSPEPINKKRSILDRVFASDDFTSLFSKEIQAKMVDISPVSPVIGKSRPTRLNLNYLPHDVMGQPNLTFSNTCPIINQNVNNEKGALPRENGENNLTTLSSTAQAITTQNMIATSPQTEISNEMRKGVLRVKSPWELNQI